MMVFLILKVIFAYALLLPLLLSLFPWPQLISEFDKPFSDDLSFRFIFVAPFALQPLEDKPIPIFYGVLGPTLDGRWDISPDSFAFVVEEKLKHEDVFLDGPLVALFFAELSVPVIFAQFWIPVDFMRIRVPFI